MPIGFVSKPLSNRVYKVVNAAIGDVLHGAALGADHVVMVLGATQ
tara:strand:- start:379 stop:513 length:135 start_codon:yes stop_codon:yes gene_type:complete